MAEDWQLPCIMHPRFCSYKTDQIEDEVCRSAANKSQICSNSAAELWKIWSHFTCNCEFADVGLVISLVSERNKCLANGETFLNQIVHLLFGIASQGNLL